MLLSATSVQPWSYPLPALDIASKCKTQMEINQIHANLITTGHIHNPSFTSKTILKLAFSRHKPNVDFARYLFFDFNYRDPFLWNAIMKSFSHGDEPNKAFQLFVLMLVRDILLDEYSFSLVLKSCSRLGLLSRGIQVHGLMLKLGFGSDLFLQNSLICFYVKCGFVQFGRQVFDRMGKKDSFSYNLMIDGYVKRGMVSSARQLFDRMPSEMKNLVSWNTMISGYLKVGNGFESAQELFDEMPQRDLVSWNLMIDCCAKNGKMESARGLFDRMPQRDVVSWASMVDGYAKLGNVGAARSYFDAMPRRDVVSCNAMMAGYVGNGCYEEALKVFHDMLGSASDLAPDSVALLTALSAATQLGCIDEGMAIRAYMEENAFTTCGKLGVALVDMYAKCGSIEQAMDVFEGIQEKTIDHWNAMIGGLAIHGQGDLAFELFMEMERGISLEPDEITFVAVLHACVHSGMIKEGMICFEVMRRLHKIVPKLQHYGCVVDLLSRAGHIEEAAKFVAQMPIQPNDVVLRTLLSACSTYENLDVGEPVAKHLIGLDSKDSSSYVLLSNMYAHFGLWEYVRKVRTLMKQREINKVPGCSWIELEGTMHEFFVGGMIDHEAIDTSSSAISMERAGLR
ncbi:pentatricopeptide repeat-containing protein At2g45350, chloroplastic [Salvia miltiorrhiza]|uniref:pentatricopeptide repeat-containing protein At2g45350, chloroplastic n=1 Tax=Salvia miltiorrhiza TaxID=226208 RepID=UPI0025AD1F97|nr:pentatricopeptide repeat-containing protein At2g45350, chloroplastic [Salvia miltiorrhiza]